MNTKKTILIDCELCVGETYNITGQCPEPFEITKIEKNKVWGIYTKRPHLGICPLDINSIHKKQIEKIVDVLVCECCLRPI